MADRSCGGAAARACGALVLFLAWSGAAADRWTLRGEDGFGPGTFFGTEVDSLGRLSLTSLRGANLALGVTGRSGENSLSGSRSVTDGSTDTEWRFNNRAELLGESISLDLRGDRGITRVRILPGKTIDQRPRFFLKGYRLEVAAKPPPTTGCWRPGRSTTPVPSSTPPRTRPGWKWTPGEPPCRCSAASCACASPARSRRTG